MTLLIFYLLLALGVSFLCSVLEAVILSVPLSFIHSQQQQGHAWAHRLRHQKDEIDRPLSAILTLNTVAHTIGAAGVGAQAVALFGKAWFGLISAVLTLLILFLSEIIPKTLGATWWRELARPASRILQVLIVLTWPLVWLSQLLMKLLARKGEIPPVSRFEVEALVRFGVGHGVFKEQESRIVSNLVGLRDVRVKDIMTPRTVMVAVSSTMTIAEFVADPRIARFSRIPLFLNSIDDIQGYVLKSDLLPFLVGGQQDRSINEFLRPIPICPEQLPVPKLLNLLLEKREKVALVTNEYGGTEGVATMEDVMETLLGQEIIDELDQHADLQDVARRRWENRRQVLNADFDKSTTNVPPSKSSD